MNEFYQYQDHDSFDLAIPFFFWDLEPLTINPFFCDQEFLANLDYIILCLLL